MYDDQAVVIHIFNTSRQRQADLLVFKASPGLQSEFQKPCLEKKNKTKQQQKNQNNKNIV